MMLYSCAFFSRFHAYMIENIPFEKGRTPHFFTQMFQKTFSPIVRQSPTCTVKVELNDPLFNPFSTKPIFSRKKKMFFF